MSILVHPAEPPQPRYYEVDGERLPRVSTVLNVLAKPGLDRWRGNLGNAECDRISREATAFGTRLHAGLEAYLLGTITVDTIGSDLRPYLYLFCDWDRANVRRTVATERRVVSRAHRYTGTTDYVAELADGDRAVIDFKTAGRERAVEPTYRLQLSAYRLALAEDGVIVNRRLILVFVKADPPRLVVHDLDGHREDTIAWLSCLELWRWLEGMRS